MFSGRAAQNLDNFITGHYGEDQLKGFPCNDCPFEDDCEIVEIVEPCPHKGTPLEEGVEVDDE